MTAARDRFKMFSFSVMQSKFCFSNVEIHTKRQVNELCFSTCVFLPCLSPQFACYFSKNNCCLFERLFKVKKNDVFLFGISSFVLEIFTFLYYANEESDDVIGGFTKTVQHSIENISSNIKAVIFKLGT